jgi:hypothetical protein
MTFKILKEKKRSKAGEEKKDLHQIAPMPAE